MTQDLYKQKKSLELNWEQEYNENGKYTLNMIQIDHKIKEIITQIKAEEARIADRENKILDSQDITRRIKLWQQLRFKDP